MEKGVILMSTIFTTFFINLKICWPPDQICFPWVNICLLTTNCFTITPPNLTYPDHHRPSDHWKGVGESESVATNQGVEGLKLEMLIDVNL